MFGITIYNSYGIPYTVYISGENVSNFNFNPARYHIANGLANITGNGGVAGNDGVQNNSNSSNSIAANNPFGTKDDWKKMDPKQLEFLLLSMMEYFHNLITAYENFTSTGVTEAQIQAIYKQMSDLCGLLQDSQTKDDTATDEIKVFKSLPDFMVHGGFTAAVATFQTQWNWDDQTKTGLFYDHILHWMGDKKMLDAVSDDTRKQDKASLIMCFAMMNMYNCLATEPQTAHGSESGNAQEVISDFYTITRPCDPDHLNSEIEGLAIYFGQMEGGNWAAVKDDLQTYLNVLCPSATSDSDTLYPQYNTFRSDLQNFINNFPSSPPSWFTDSDWYQTLTDQFDAGMDAGN